MWINSLAKNLNKKDYRSVRVCSRLTLTDAGRVATSAADTCWKYTVWCVYPFSLNHYELFDLGRDPGEVNNLYGKVNGSQPDGQRFINRLDALLQVMGMCKVGGDGRGCAERGSGRSCLLHCRGCVIKGVLGLGVCGVGWCGHVRVWCPGVQVV